MLAPHRWFTSVDVLPLTKDHCQLVTPSWDDFIQPYVQRFVHDDPKKVVRSPELIGILRAESVRRKDRKQVMQQTSLKWYVRQKPSSKFDSRGVYRELPPSWPKQVRQM